MAETCLNCKNNLNGNYCSNCGLPKIVKRINGRYIISEFGSVLQFEKGILYTIRELLLRPGANVRTFIKEDRNRLVKPILFIIITSLVYTICEQWLKFEEGYVQYSNIDTDSATSSIFVWIQSHYGYANILMAFFISFWLKLFFRKQEINFFEILILMCFVMGIAMLLYTFFGVIEALTSLRVLQLGGILGIGYASWAIGQFYDKTKKVNYIKALVSYMLGMLTFFIGAVLLGYGIDAWI